MKYNATRNSILKHQKRISYLSKKENARLKREQLAKDSLNNIASGQSNDIKKLLHEIE